MRTRRISRTTAAAVSLLIVPFAIVFRNLYLATVCINRILQDEERSTAILDVRGKKSMTPDTKSSAEYSSRLSKRAISTTINKSSMDSIQLTSEVDSPTVHQRALAANASQFLSACILIMDENPRLPEWLAYNYFALRLRYLVVGIDPRSTESPTPILDRWRRWISDLTIIEWDEASHFYSELGHATNLTPSQYLKQSYEQRQRKFMRACTIHMKLQQRSFVAYHDVDEYLAINEQIIPNAQALAAQPDNVWNILSNMDPHNATRGNYRISNHSSADACYLFARRTFPAKSSPPEMIQRDVPMGFNGTQFESLRWRHYHMKSHGLDVPGKTILDLSRIPIYHIVNSYINPHASLANVCQNGFAYYDKVLGYHHYAGSRELFFRKNDSRAEWMEELWAMRSNVSAPAETDEICPWLKGFVAMIGEEKARALLKDAGNLEIKYLTNQ